MNHLLLLVLRGFTKNKLLVYQTDDGQIKLDVRLQDETVWLTQPHMAELFQVKPQNITMHLKNIYEPVDLMYFCPISAYALPMGPHRCRIDLPACRF